MITTIELKAQGYVCHRETIKGQGYYGGDGTTCYRVRRPDGSLAVYSVSTHRTARGAWQEAVRIARDQ